MAVVKIIEQEIVQAITAAAQKRVALMETPPHAGGSCASWCKSRAFAHQGIDFRGTSLIEPEIDLPRHLALPLIKSPCRTPQRVRLPELVGSLSRAQQIVRVSDGRFIRNRLDTTRPIALNRFQQIIVVQLLRHGGARLGSRVIGRFLNSIASSELVGSILHSLPSAVFIAFFLTQKTFMLIGADMSMLRVFSLQARERRYCVRSSHTFTATRSPRNPLNISACADHNTAIEAELTTPPSYRQK